MENEHVLKYKGNVSVYMQRGNKKILLGSSANAGGLDLFHFFAECLAGHYSEADKYLPTKLALFYNENDYSAASSDPWKETDTKKIYTRSLLIRTDEDAKISPVVKSDTSEVVSYMATLHFKIPFAAIQAGTDANAKKINQFVVYTNNTTAISTTNKSSGSCAVYLKTKKVDETTVWDPIDTSGWGTNYNLVIEWSMKVID